MGEDSVEISGPDRRPIAARSSAWAQWLAARLARSPITPNQISLFSVVLAAIGAALITTGGAVGLVVAALCIQLRLLCNLLDGMVAVEGGKASPLGAIYNEFPDRVTDSLFLVSAGYAAGAGWLGWLAALIAVATAYVRVFGGALGLRQDFSGIMAKQRRMMLLTLGLLAQAAETPLNGTGYSLLVALALIALGSLVTCGTRTAAIARKLKA
jgi:phosphatidylglycerophosphate synthase